MYKEVMHYQPGQEPQGDGILGNAQQNKPITFIRVALYCGFNEEGTWTVKASGVLTMEKWPEKVKSKDKDQQGEGAQKSGPKEVLYLCNANKHIFFRFSRASSTLTGASTTFSSVFPCPKPTWRTAKSNFVLSLWCIAFGKCKLNAYYLNMYMFIILQSIPYLRFLQENANVQCHCQGYW